MNSIFNIPFLEKQPAASAGTALPKRSAIDDKFKWQLNDIYPTRGAFEAELTLFKKNITKLNDLKTTFISSAKALADGLDFIDAMTNKFETLYSYARLHRDTETSNAEYQSMTSRVENIIPTFAAAAAFVEPAIISLPEETLRSWIKNEPALDNQKFPLEKLLRQKKHILSPAEEKLLALTADMQQSANNIYTMFTNADMKFPDTLGENGTMIPLSESRYNSLIRSQNRAVRKSAFEKLFTTYSSYRHTMAATYESSVKAAVFNARARHYDSTLQAALDKTNVPVNVYKNMINTIKNNISVMHEYMQIKKQVLKLDELHMYDLYVPLTTKTPDHYSYDEGLKLIFTALQPLGSQYLADLKAGTENGWVDIYENKDKLNGAYSLGVYDVHPYVLLNYDEQYGDVSTAIHEFGHAMHSFYSNKYQTSHNAHYTIFCAETASTTNEVLLLQHMLKTESNPEKQLFFINQHLEQVRTTVHRQTLFAEFEMLTHEKVENGEPLTADILEQLWLDLNHQYYGDAVVIDDIIKIEWARIPHFYRPFYVYQYVTGYAAATTLANSLLAEGEPARQRYLKYLSSGAADYSLNLLKNAGVDMASPEPIKITLDKFAESLHKLKALCK